MPSEIKDELDQQRARYRELYPDVEPTDLRTALWATVEWFHAEQEEVAGAR